MEAFADRLKSKTEQLENEIEGLKRDANEFAEGEGGDADDFKRYQTYLVKAERFLDEAIENIRNVTRQI